MCVCLRLILNQVENITWCQKLRTCKTLFSLRFIERTVCVSMATSTSSSSASQSQNAGSSFPTFLQSNIPVPGKLDLRGNLAVNLKKFRRIWENYEIATHLNKQDSSLRVATLLSCIGSDVLDIFDGLSFDTEADRQDINKVLEKLEAYYIGETNETYERYVFNKRDQQQGESFDSYLSALRSLIKTCNFGTKTTYLETAWS